VISALALPRFKFPESQRFFVPNVCDSIISDWVVEATYDVQMQTEGRAMIRILLPLCAMSSACTPSPREEIMISPNSSITTKSSSETKQKVEISAFPNSIKANVQDRVEARQAPTLEPMSAAANLAPSFQSDPSAEANGRKVLSTAFVMVDAHGQLTVELRDGRVLVLRDVVMRPRDYCGVDVRSRKIGARYCGAYADVIAARPGGSLAIQ